MPRTRHSEFVSFVQNSRNCTHGALQMKGDVVRSYALVIAKVDRAAKTIEINMNKNSATTSRHQRAVSYGSIDLIAHHGYTVVHSDNISV